MRGHGVVDHMPDVLNDAGGFVADDMLDVLDVEIGGIWEVVVDVFDVEVSKEKSAQQCRGRWQPREGEWRIYQGRRPRGPRKMRRADLPMTETARPEEGENGGNGSRGSLAADSGAAPTGSGMRGNSLITPHVQGAVVARPDRGKCLRRSLGLLSVLSSSDLLQTFKPPRLWLLARPSLWQAKPDQSSH